MWINLKTVKNLTQTIVVFGFIGVTLTACSSLPDIKHSVHRFPKDQAFFDPPKRKFETLGLVRSEVNFPTLDPDSDNEDALCRNYFNQAVKKLVGYAKDAGGDAVIDVKSVVFLMDGRSEMYPKPECSDDGGEGQVLARGIAVKWLPENPESKQESDVAPPKPVSSVPLN